MCVCNGVGNVHCVHEFYNFYVHHGLYKYVRCGMG